LRLEEARQMEQVAGIYAREIFAKNSTTKTQQPKRERQRDKHF